MDRKVKDNDMTTLEKMWDNGIAICFAANESYAPYCKVALASLLNCRNKDKNYDILIMTKDMTEQSRNGILALEDSGVSIRFVDMTCMESQGVFVPGAAASRSATSFCNIPAQQVTLSL